MPVNTTTACSMFALCLLTTAVSASEPSSLVDLPVTGTAIVPASKYPAALSRAARSGSPVDIALSVAGAFEGARQVIVQTNEGAESPSASRVIVIRDGLLDDAMQTVRWDVFLTRKAAGAWQITEVTTAWRCWRGAKTAGLAAQPCP